MLMPFGTDLRRALAEPRSAGITPAVAARRYDTRGHTKGHPHACSDARKLQIQEWPLMQV